MSASDPQSSDLVSRLIGAAEESSYADLFSEAADEIERLRGALETAARGRKEFQALCREMLARVEKIP